MSRYIQKLIEEGEHQRLDFKFEIADAKKIARTMSAFANTNGGRLLIGVKDNGVIAGVRSDEDIYMAEAAAQLYCKPEVVIETKEWNINGKKVLEVYIPKSDQKHTAPDKNKKIRAFVRVKDQNFVANTIQINIWKRQRSSKGVDFQFDDITNSLLRLISELRKVKFREIQRKLKLSRYHVENLLTDLVLLNILEMEFTEKGIWFSLKQEKQK